jgi:YidC/Oxa1 family membrane protein insertase
MDRNLILAIVISIVIIVAFQFFFQSVAPPPKKPPATIEKVAGKDASEQAGPQKPASQPVTEETKPEPKPHMITAAPAQEPAIAATKDSKVTVDALNYEAVLSSNGGRIISFKLKDYTQTLGDGSLVNLFDPAGPDSSGPSIMFTRRDETFNDSGLTFACDAGDSAVVLDRKGAKKSITFKAATAAGLTLTKTYTFYADSYSIDFSVTLTNDSGEARNYLVTFPWRKVYKGEEKDARFAWNSAEILLNGELKDYYFKDIKGDEEPSGKIQWAGLGDIYFFKALVLGDRPGNKVTLFKPTKEGIAEIWVRYGDVDLPPGKPANLNLALYLGPKEHEALAAAGHSLSRALFYSTYWVLDIICQYLVIFLKLCNSGFQVLGIKIPGTHNYGIDILILTVLIKILFIPLTHKSMKSMKRMQEIQPQIAKLKEKFKDDKAALNKGTMDLFREHKVSPLGSCWPMFLQMPVFIALYQALSYAIELRHAYFVCIPSIYLCINDLSAPDPYYVTPVLMGGTMVLQQWMTPSAGDPMQKKMMLMMPVVFTWLFLSFPSGLVLYWLVSNILSIAQQVITNRMAK